MSGSVQSKQINRLPSGGLVARRESLSFHFDGVQYSGYGGDTLSSALLANGVKLLGRSFKYHRPRGILTAGLEEPNALVELRLGSRREPNTRATAAELFDGLQARSQNRWPSLTFDVGAVNSLLAPLFVAGFYYKTFMWPAPLWEKFYEPAIRHAAGLGRSNGQPDPDSYEKSHAFCDVLVIGAGPAGLSAALSAGRSGARVILCEEDFALGGRLLGDRREVNGLSGIAWVHQVELELESLPNVRIMRRTTVFGAYDGNTYGAAERVADHLRLPFSNQPRQRLWRIVAKRVVLAAGAIERPIVFGGNDRPGVMMASAVRTYLNRFSVSSGRHAALFTTTDDGWKTAHDLKTAGIDVRAIIDARPTVSPRLLARSQAAGTQVLLGAHVIATHGARGLKALTVRERDGRLIRVSADILAMSGGWSPNLALTTHLGGRPQWNREISAFVPSNEPHGLTVAGAARGSLGLADALREGTTAGIDAATATGHTKSKLVPPKADDEETGMAPLWYVPGSLGKSFVDFQHDVTRDDVALAAREGFRSVEHLKRYTTLGMGTDQGKTSSVNGLAALAELTGRDISDVGTTVLRPPYIPVAIGTFAGHHRGKDFKPTRQTSGHYWAERHGAKFVEVGLWMRAQWFSAPGDSSAIDSVVREAKAVRTSVGICDVSTLGKIDVQGTDAGEFLDRVYTNTFSTLPIAKARYGLMLREDGFALDDGTCARLASDHYIMSTTTVNAPKVMQHLEHARQVLWPQLDVQIVSITEQWAQYSIAGPNSRRLLERLLGAAIDISNSAFPFLACAEFFWRGIPARLFRISFSGELAYELSVPARYGVATLQAIMSAGEEWNATPYGTEALGTLRIEKGHVAGNELNGTTTAADLGLGRMMSSKKDFIGRVLATRSGLTDPRRPTLVGVKPLDRRARLHAGAHFLSRNAAVNLMNDQGYLTSVAFSPIMGCWIGLGFLSRGPERWGEHIRAYDPLRKSDTEVEVVSPVFFDPEGRRLVS